jgi:hypothetical protein
MGSTASVEKKTCSHCGKTADELLRLDADMKQRVAGDLGVKTVADAVCASCYQSFGNQLSNAAQKRARKLAKEQHRLNLWRSRVHLIREARDRFAVKDFAGSVVAYEKYFRVLEIIYEVKPNEIQVSHFNNSARSKELVVIASAYWDLVRIYDQSPRFKGRLDQCAQKLGEFLPYTPIYGEILRKIEDYKKNAKNKDAFEAIIRRAGKEKRRCFIATAAFEDADALPVVTLAEFRDRVLIKNNVGRAFIAAYYLASPPIAKLLDRSPHLRSGARLVLRPLARLIGAKYNLKTGRN